MFSSRGDLEINHQNNNIKTEFSNNFLLKQVHWLDQNSLHLSKKKRSASTGIEMLGILENPLLCHNIVEKRRREPNDIDINIYLVKPGLRFYEGPLKTIFPNYCFFLVSSIPWYFMEYMNR